MAVLNVRVSVGNGSTGITFVWLAVEVKAAAASHWAMPRRFGYTHNGCLAEMGQFRSDSQTIPIDMRRPLQIRHQLAGLAILCVLPLVASAQQVDSGLAIGEQAQTFDVKDCTGPAAGKTLCYFCRYSRRPVVAVFVDDLGGKVPALIQQVDRLVGEHRTERLAAFVVYTGDDSAEIEGEMKTISRERRVRHTPLTIVRGGRALLEERYAVAPAAAVTILMWREIRIKDRLAFESTDVPSESVESLPDRVADLVK